MHGRTRVKRRHSGAAAADSGQNVKVAVRCRPMNEKEKNKNCSAVIQCENSRKEVSVKLDDVKMAAFNFDYVFDDSATQEQVYRSVVADVVEEALQGFNCTAFAYGQTGTGKTYTMEGHRDTKKGNAAFWYGKHAGMIPRATQHIFQHLDACCTNYKVEASYLELYNEDIIDLLNPDVNSKPLNLHYDSSKKAVVVPGLREVEVTCPEDLFKTLDVAAEKRHTAETLLNKNSSRSHCVFTVTIRIQESLGNGEDLIRVGKLNLVDLAGSENTKRSGAKDDVLKQAVMINRSLLALGRVITALTSGHSDKHIPYRDSKLTRLLQESLGGRAKTCLIATISPSDDCLDETRSTLKYAFRAKDIKNKPVLSKQLTKKAQIKLDKDYAEEIDSLKNQLWAARSKEGFFVDPTTWQTTLEELEQAKQEAEDLKLAMTAKEELHNHLQTHFERKSTELNMSIEKCKQKERELEEAIARQQKAEAALQQSKEALMDRDAVIARQVHTERNLTREASSLVTTVQQAAGDVQQLHTKVAAQEGLSAKAQAVASAHGASLRAAIEELQRNIGSHQTSQQEQHSRVRNIVEEQAMRQQQCLAAICKAGASLKDLTGKFVGELHEAHTEDLKAREQFAAGQLSHQSSHLKDSVGRIAAIRDQCSEVMSGLTTALQGQYGSLLTWKSGLLEMLEEVDSSAAQYSESHLQALQELQEAAGQLAEEVQEKVQEQNNTLAGVQMLHEELLDKAKAEIMGKLQAALYHQVETAKQELAQGLEVVATGIQASATMVRSHAESQAARVGQASDAAQSYQMVHMEQTKNLRNAAEQLREDHDSALQTHCTAITTSQQQLAEGLQADATVREASLEERRQATSEHLATARRRVEEDLSSKLHEMKDATNSCVSGQIQQVAQELEQHGSTAAQGVTECLQTAGEALDVAVSVQSSGLDTASGEAQTFLSDISECTYKPTATTPKKTKQYQFPANLPATCPHEEIVAKRRDGSLEAVPTDVEIMQLLTNLAEEHQEKEEQSAEQAEKEASPATRKSPRTAQAEAQATTAKKRRTRSGSLTKENHTNTSSHGHEPATKASRRQMKAPRSYKSRSSAASEQAGSKRARATTTADPTAATKRQKVLRTRRAAAH